MKHLSLAAALVALCSCPGPRPEQLPPADAFYFPTGMVHADTGPGEGVLFVVTSNFDKRFDNGTISAVNLNRVGLPAFGAPVAATGPVVLTNLFIDPTSIAKISSFGGELASRVQTDGSRRLFVPARSEGQRLHAVDVLPLAGPDDVPVLQCVPFDPAAPRDCVKTAPSMVTNEKPRDTVIHTGNTGNDADTETRENLPRAQAPIGVAVSQATGDVWVTHASAVDSPRGSGKNLTAYLVHTMADAPTIENRDFINISAGATHAVAIGSQWAFASGRYFAASTYLVRMVDAQRRVLNTGLEGEFKAIEARGIALSSDQTRLYLAGRTPDSLLVASVTGATQGFPVVPQVRAIRTVPLPEAPQYVVTVPRDAPIKRSDLVLVSSSAAGMLSIYDDDVGDLVAQVPGVGLQPSSIAVDVRSPGARVYVSNFTDGQVAVIDIPDLNRPQEARVVAHLGRSQLCVTRGLENTSCTEAAIP